MADPPLIYDYLDYRIFLGDFIAYKKSLNKIYSYRFWARSCGFSSPNFIKLVVEGKRNLSHESIGKIADGFSLDHQARDFFENLVLMNQASNLKDKDRYYRKMLAVKEYSKIARLGRESYEYFSKWYCPAIREMIGFKGLKQTYDEIAESLAPSISAKEVEKALVLLEGLGLIRKDEDGKYVRSDKAVTTGPEVQSLVVGNYHREMIRLAGESLDRFPKDERNITSLTLGIDSEKMDEIVRRIAALRADLLQMASTSKKPGQVVQVNFQVFPLSKKI